MARGGARQGTPGKGYSNRTDLLSNRAPQTGTQTAASAGVAAPPSPAPSPSAGAASGPPPGMVFPEDVPKLNDPTARPLEPITAGLDIGKGPGAEALGYFPPDPTIQTLQAAYLVNPTPQLRRVIAALSAKGLL